MKTLTTLFVLFLSIVLPPIVPNAAAQVKFRFGANPDIPASIKEKVETNISALLTQINAAAADSIPLNFAGIDIEEGAAERLAALWSGVRFSCNKKLNISKSLEDVQGYQVRGIFITMQPVDDSYTQSLDRELTVSVNRVGEITGVRLAMETQEDVNKILSEGVAVTDLRQRRELLKFVEDFRCYYNERNLDALEKIFSDNALIITGSVIKKGQRSTEGAILEESKVKYKVLSKQQYIDNLAKVFRNNARLEVDFDRIQVVQNASKEGVYGVTLHQSWKSSSYSDEGWLFLYWDLSDPDEPKIMIRTWQEDEIVQQHGVFNINDFFIP